MKALAVVVAAILLLAALVIVSQRMRTVREVKRIEALQGQSGEFAELTKTIRTSHQFLEPGPQVDSALATLGFPTASITNLLVARFNGEGLPYFWGYVAYDRNARRVVAVKVEQLW